jgi:hypothetical protein
MSDDFVSDLLKRLKRLLPSISDQELESFEESIRNDWGGAEPYIAKKKISAEKKKRAVDEYIGGRPLKEIREKTGVSRASLYRHLKKP